MVLCLHFSTVGLPVTIIRQTPSHAYFLNNNLR